MVDGSDDNVNRRSEIDWLRFLAVLLLFPFHTAMVYFSREGFYVKSENGGLWIDLLVLFLSPWHMPLLFVLAGMSSRYALDKRSGVEYVKERSKRLMIPLLFGLLVLVPPQAYVGYLRIHADASFFEFLRGYFFTVSDDFTGYAGGFTPAHLWFILYLYVYSVLSVPLFSYLMKRGTEGCRWLDSWGAFIVFCYPIVLGLAEQLPSVSTKNPFYYYTYFLAGFFIGNFSTWDRTIERKRWRYVVLGVVTMSVYLYLSQFDYEKYSVADVMFYILRKFNGWLWVLGVLGCGRRYLRCKNSVLNYGRTSSYPIYLLHQTVVVLIAYIVVEGHTISCVLFQFIGIVVLSMFVTFFIYDIIIRRISVFRILFGMK